MPKRVAIVSSSCPPAGGGGVSSAHYNLYLALKRRGYVARMFTFNDYHTALHEGDVIRAGVPPWFEKMVDVVTRLYFRVVDPGKLAYHFGEVLSFAWPCFTLRSRIREFAPDALVLSDHGCPGLLIGQPPECRTVLVSHHNPARFLNNPLWNMHSEHDSRLTIRCENWVLRGVDAVVCPTDYMRDMFEKTYNYAGPVTVIPNLVDANFIAATPSRDLRPLLGLQADSPLVYIPSAGSVYKGSGFVFEIIRRLSSHAAKDVGFYLSGSLDQKLAHELRFVPTNAKIHAPGRVGYAENLANVKACSFAVSPTLVENFGMALLEANLCGVPVVSFDVGGNAEVIRHGTSGILVPYLDVEALVRAALRFMDDTYRSAFRRDMARYGADCFAEERIVRAYMAILDGPTS